ncbi:MAG TPA: penicillin-binding protein activator [Steroidobacteraceae bacterium]|jgi:outer membrane PBP1 activator LpoA protein|nr:penicillin-binding protein activator [Steroidobacteraceae bacterium]
MFDARWGLRGMGAAALLALAGCSLVNTTAEAPPAPVPRSTQQPPPPQPPPQPAPLQTAPASAVTPANAAGNVALLMPISGKLSSAGISLREGFMTAYYHSPADERLHIRFYDTAELGVPTAVAQATRDGAQLIVGPLARDAVVAAAAITSARAPILALNFLPAGTPVPPAFYQYALSPEEEARQVARRVLADGHHAGVALVPTGDWGTRVLAAFTQELQSGGGTLLAQASVDAGLTDYAPEITQVLRISDSRARAKRLESVIGAKLEFEPRPRGDIEFIFAASQVNTARLLLPQLRFHYVGGIPTYATADSFEPNSSANQDLEGLLFPDMPWMLGSELADAVHDAARSAWPSGGPNRNRLFAFGFDAYLLAAALHAQAGATQVDVQGLTGRLSLDAERRVHRELEWGAMHNGQARVLPAPGGN